MKFKRMIVFGTLLFRCCQSLLIPWSKYEQLEIAFIKGLTAELQGLDASDTEVKQLILFLGNVTNLTGSELAAMFRSQDYSLAIFLKAWIKLVQTFVASDFGLGPTLKHNFNVENKVCTHKPQKGSAQAPSAMLEPANYTISVDTARDDDGVKITFNVKPKQEAGSSAAPPKINHVVSQLLNRTYGAEMSYESLQKWIDDYGLSASSLRDYLETYLFAGEGAWTVKIATQDTKKTTEREQLLDLNDEATFFVASADPALPKASKETAHGGDKAHPSFLLERPDTDLEAVAANGTSTTEHSSIQKRFSEFPSDYSALVYAFLRIDTEDQNEDKESEDDPESHKPKLKHRIFDNDEIILPVSTQGMGQSSARSKEYRQVVYDGEPTTIHLTKREKEDEKEEEDCVPVTWYNVLHHSVFGKHKFCHV